MNAAVTVRKLVVYLATGVFFAVAAISELQGVDTMDAFVKAGISCAIVAVLGRIVVGIVDGAVQKADKAAGEKSEPMGAATQIAEAAAPPVVREVAEP